MLQHCSCNKPINTCWKAHRQYKGWAEPSNSILWPELISRGTSTSWQGTGVHSPAEPATYGGAALAVFWVSHSTRAVTPAPKSCSVPWLLGLSCRWLRWLSLRRRPRALQLLCSGTQGSTGFWPVRETPHPSLPVADNLATAFPPWITVEAENRQDFPASELVWFSSFPLPFSPHPRRSWHICAMSPSCVTCDRNNLNGAELNQPPCPNAVATAKLSSMSSSEVKPFGTEKTE